MSKKIVKTTGTISKFTTITKPGKHKLKRDYIEKAKIESGLGETTLEYRGLKIHPSRFVNYDKYDNQKCPPGPVSVWEDTPRGSAVAWVNGELFIYPNQETKENRKVDATTRYFFINGKKKKADDIIIIKSDNYGNLIRKEQEAYEELIAGLKYLDFTGLQYAEMLEIISKRMKIIAQREKLDKDFKELVSPDEKIDFKNAAKMPAIKEMLKQTTKEEKKEYEELDKNGNS